MTDIGLCVKCNCKVVVMFFESVSKVVLSSNGMFQRFLRDPFWDFSIMIIWSKSLNFTSSLHFLSWWFSWLKCLIQEQDFSIFLHLVLGKSTFALLPHTHTQILTLSLWLITSSLSSEAQAWNLILRVLHFVLFSWNSLCHLTYVKKEVSSYPYG